MRSGRRFGEVTVKRESSVSRTGRRLLREALPTMARTMTQMAACGTARTRARMTVPTTAMETTRETVRGTAPTMEAAPTMARTTMARNMT